MRPNPFSTDMIGELRAAAIPMRDDSDCRAIVDAAASSSFVLIGEASHGTEEFYRLRAEITRRLIAVHGFSAVAIEGDWPDAHRVNRFVRARGTDTNARQALAGFRRFPTWMWRNSVVEEFVAWLRKFNDQLGPEERVGFYGLDLYSLHSSMRAVVQYLEKHDPAAARAARESYACFENFGNDTNAYAWATAKHGEGSCEEAVTRELVRLRDMRANFLGAPSDAVEDDELFHAQQNARLALNAERYYRTMFHGRHESWNVRDQHMAETLEELRVHLERRHPNPRIVVWAHNSHLGDARATQMGESGELNLGQLVRERYPDDCFLLGLTTHGGTVMAAHDWDEPGAERPVRAALPDSYEFLFHQVGIDRFYLPLENGSLVSRLLESPRLERAIGVVYRPETERQSHYFHCRLPQQFDGIVHIDRTSAVEPLGALETWESEVEAPETYPTGV